MEKIKILGKSYDFLYASDVAKNTHEAVKKMTFDEYQSFLSECMQVARGLL